MSYLVIHFFQLEWRKILFLKTEKKKKRKLTILEYYLNTTNIFALLTLNIFVSEIVD